MTILARQKEAKQDFWGQRALGGRKRVANQTLNNQDGHNEDEVTNTLKIKNMT